MNRTIIELGGKLGVSLDGVPSLIETDDYLLGSLSANSRSPQSLDLIWAGNSFLTSAEPEGILNKVTAWLRPEGLLIVSVGEQTADFSFLSHPPFFPLINFPELIALLAADFQFYSAYPDYGLNKKASNEEAIAAYWKNIDPKLSDLCVQAKRWQELYQETRDPDFLERFNNTYQIIRGNYSETRLPSVQYIALSRKGEKS